MDIYKMSMSPPYEEIKTDSLLEGWNSFIWTERYLPAGEFELRTHKIQDTIDMLSGGFSFLTISESREIMHVDTFEIDNNQEKPELVVKGVSCETWFDGRVALMDYPPSSDIPQDLDDIPRFKKYKSHPNYVARIVLNEYSEWHPLFQIHLSNSLGSGIQVYKLNAGEEIYSWVLDILREDDFGLRADGIFIPGKITVAIYKGKDRTAGQSTNTPVILSPSAGHILNPSYLISSKKQKNTAYVEYSYSGMRSGIGRHTVSSGEASFNNRALLTQAGNYTWGDSDLYTSLNSIGRKLLAKHKKVDVFDGEISPDSPYKFDQDYWLGDKVTVMSDFGQTKKTMQVTEYTRAQTLEGYREYPTLSHIE